MERKPICVIDSPSTLELHDGRTGRRYFNTTGGFYHQGKDAWRRVSKREPCPICGKPDNCSVSVDGGAVWCGRVSDGSVRENVGGQYLHVLGDRWDALPPVIPAPKPRPKPQRDLSLIHI